MTDDDAPERLERALAAQAEARYVLKLYVVGATSTSRRAISALRQVCEEELAGRYTLEVVDIYQQPALAAGEQIIAAPTLVKELPLPVRRLVGDMTDKERVLVGLDLRARALSAMATHDTMTDEEVRARLAEAEETLRAIRQGEIDALVVDASGRAAPLHPGWEPTTSTACWSRRCPRAPRCSTTPGRSCTPTGGSRRCSGSRSRTSSGSASPISCRPSTVAPCPARWPATARAPSRRSPISWTARVAGPPVAVSRRALRGDDSARHALVVTDLSRIEEADRERRRAQQLYEREHAIAVELQRAVGPGALPRLDWVELASIYEPGGEDVDVGGDWYDALPLADGRLGLLIGDVAGRGLVAAIRMAELRNALRAYVHQGLSPAETLQHLNELSLGGMATVFFGILDADARTLRYVERRAPAPGRAGARRDRAQAAHRGALPADRGTGAHHLPGHGGRAPRGGHAPALHRRARGGAGRVARRRARPAHRRRGRARPRAAGPVHRAACAAPPGTTHAVEDDVAILGTRLVAPPRGELEFRIPAELRALAGFRGRLRRFLGANGVDGEALHDLILAATELATNAVEHAYGPGDAEFECSVSVRDGTVRIVLRDHGRWRPWRESTDDRGRGIALAEALVDVLQLQRTEHGTETVIERRLAGAAR